MICETISSTEVDWKYVSSIPREWKNLNNTISTCEQSANATIAYHSTSPGTRFAGMKPDSLSLSDTLLACAFLPLKVISYNTRCDARQLKIPKARCLDRRSLSTAYMVSQIIRQDSPRSRRCTRDTVVVVRTFHQVSFCRPRPERDTGSNTHLR